jgi:hypothetical protein
MSQERSDAAARVEELLRGYFVSQGIYVAAKLGLADLLARGAGGAGVDELARETATDAGGLYRLLRALASEGVFAELPGQRFVLNEMGAVLCRDAAGSQHHAALLAGETQYKVWTQLKETLRPGAPTGFERIFRVPLFSFLAEHPEAYAVFNAAMEQRVKSATAALLAACEVRAGDVIVDVGGGTGSVLRALLEKHAGARGTLLETVAVVEEARRMFADSAVGERVTLVAGDCLESVPAGEVMILVTVLHMFQDAPALRIVRNCRAALSAGGRLYIAEALLRGPNEKDAGKWQDVNMMLMTGGRERTFEEYGGLLQEAGLGVVKQIGPIIEARL